MLFVEILNFIEIKKYSRCGINSTYSRNDILYIGGGTDREQLTACESLRKAKDSIKSYADDGGTILAFAAGYPLLGEYYELNNEKIKALELIDMYTEQSKDRYIGNIILESGLLNSTIVGFENHNSKTFINNQTPLGKVIYGYGNSGKRDFEGVVNKNVIGTYLHGPLLPKNAKLADYILQKALNKKYGTTELQPLDDNLENMAHEYIVNRYKR